LRRPLLRWDRRAAGSADVYVVNSSRTRDMVRDAYGIESEIIHPPSEFLADGPTVPIDGIEPGFFVCVARLLPYKNLESLLAAFEQMPAERLVIVGSGPDRARLLSLAPPNVTFLHDISDGQLRWVYSVAEALFAIGLEDFGLTPIEAASFGVPTIARAFGGYLDTVIEGVNGRFLSGLEPADIQTAVDELRRDRLDPVAVRRTTERFSQAEFTRRMSGVIERVRRSH
jgi:glycosyltransferase involved in cell wall biosynthesis